MLKTRNRRLLFRSYLTLAGGLLAVAVILDFGFTRLQPRDSLSLNQWLETTAALIESRLASVAPQDRDATAATIAAEIGVGVQLLAREDVAVNDATHLKLTPLVDSSGNTSYLHDGASIDAIIRLGPIIEPKETLLFRLIPPLFYASILVLVGLWLRPLLRDVNVISDAAQRFAADYREPLTIAGQTSELTPLARNLDDMASRLSGVLSSQKELIAALSHEMRTPLARLRFALAVSGDKTGAELKKQLAAMNHDIQEIDDLVTSMLEYARLDHPDIQMHWQEVPGSAWLNKVAAKIRSSTLEFEAITAPTIDKLRMDPRLMELALSNLLVNAQKYAAGQARCSLSVRDNEYCLAVDDNGPGIPVAARESVFRAFTRIDDSRSRETGGSGLGLAIVSRVAQLHGGTAVATTSPDLKGARFEIRWPLAT